METLTRRALLRQATRSCLTLSALSLLVDRRVLANPARVTAVRWLRDAGDLARAARAGTVTPVQWQSQMEALLAAVDLPDLLRFVDFDALAGRTSFPLRGESFVRLAVPKGTGLPADLGFYHNLAGFRRGRSIPPHGHENLVSALHGRHFERVRDEGDDCFIRPTIDKEFGAGAFSTVSDRRDNVHWFFAMNDGAFVLDLGVAHLDPHWQQPAMTPERRAYWKAEAASRPPGKSDRVYLNILAGKRVEDGLWRVPRMIEQEAYKRYG